MRRFLTLLAVVAIALAIPQTVLAQQPTVGSLEIRVVDGNGDALPGATVTITGPLGERGEAANSNGVVQFPSTPVGTYRVRVEMRGFATVEIPDVDVNAGQRTRLPVALASGTVEMVTVISSTPLVDPDNLEVANTFKTNEAAEALPIGRNFVDALAFAPGVVSGLGTGQGNYSIGGSSGLENSYIIDGVNITDSGYGGVGTYSIVFGSLGTGITTDFLDEVQVKTAGFEAEYGQALGGVISGVVKSGTNDFTGSVKVFSEPDSFEAYGKDVSLPTGAINTHDRTQLDIGLSAGGPIVKDRAFWFAAYNPVSTSFTNFIQEVPNPFTDFDAGALQTYPDDLVFPGALGSREITRDRDNYAVKFNILANSNHWFDITGFGDPSDGDGRSGISVGTIVLDGDSDGDGLLDPGAQKIPAGFADNGQRSTIDYGADQQSIRYNGLFPGDWFVEGQVSHRKNTFEERSIDDDYRYQDLRPYFEWLIPVAYFGFQTIGETGIPLAGGAGFIGPTSDETYDYALKATKSFGDHELKFGGQYYDLEYRQVSVYSGPEFTLPFPAVGGGTIPIQTNSGALVQVRGGIPGCADCAVSNEAVNPYYRVTRARFGADPGPTTGKETALFIQDTWNVTDRWTVKLGVRSTSQKLTGATGFTINLTQVGSAFTTDPQTFTPQSYKFDTEFSPRIGVSFDPWANGKGKAFVHYARYFERVPADLAVRQFSNEVGTSRFEFTDPQLTNWRGGSINLQGLSQGTIADGTKLPYMDEYVVGWEQLIRPDLSFEVRGIYRDQGRVLEDVQYGTIEAIENFYYGYNDYNDNGLIDADGNGDGVNDQLEIPFPSVCAAGAQWDPGVTPDTNDLCFNVFQPYILANPGENTEGPFGTPVREYKALEVEFNKRMSNNWTMTANYRYSRLRGNYEGLFRNDNGQSDPNITSLFDFPNSNLMRGQYASGPLNSDRPHVLNLLGRYVFDFGLELGGVFQWQSGTPRTALLAHPNYQNSGELPGQDPQYIHYDYDSEVSMGWVSGPATDGSVTLLEEYTDAPRGSLGRLPDFATFDVHAGYAFKLPKNTNLKLTLDVFNLFNSQEATAIDDAVEFTASVPNSNFNKIRGYQLPRAVRVAANFTW